MASKLQAIQGLADWLRNVNSSDPIACNEIATKAKNVSDDHEDMDRKLRSIKQLLTSQGFDSQLQSFLTSLDDIETRLRDGTPLDARFEVMVKVEEEHKVC